MLVYYCIHQFGDNVQDPNESLLDEIKDYLSNAKGGLAQQYCFGNQPNPFEALI